MSCATRHEHTVVLPREPAVQDLKLKLTPLCFKMLPLHTLNYLPGTLNVGPLKMLKQQKQSSFKYFFSIHNGTVAHQRCHVAKQ
jgi:hypothetical protein